MWRKFFCLLCNACIIATIPVLIFIASKNQDLQSNKEIIHRHQTTGHYGMSEKVKDYVVQRIQVANSD